MLASFYEYISAFFAHWVWIVTGGPFAVERILKQHPGYEPWAKRYISSGVRTWTFVLLANFGVFFAGFLAFNDEKVKLEDAKGKLEAVRSPSYIPYRPIDQSAFDRLSSEFSKFAGQSTFVAYAIVDRSATEVAEKIHFAFKKANMISSMSPGGIDADDNDGIQLVIRDHDHPTAQDQAYIAGFKASGIQFRVEEMPKDDNLQAYRFFVWVGPYRY